MLTEKELQQLRNDGMDKAADEIEKFRAALVACEHQTHSMRVWNGNGWTYQWPQVEKIARFARAALDA